MNIMKHVTGQPFVFSTGLAALVHSTWSLGTLFAGTEPAQFSLAWFAWLLPALLIAFALDVGQIVTSAEIRAGARARAKYATFIVFAAATYYLQWLYIAHHMPSLDLAPGVRESWSSAASLLRDAAIWFIPALLPMSTTLYTFSHTGRPESNRNADVHTAGISIQGANPAVTLPGQQLPVAAKCDDRQSVTPALPDPQRLTTPALPATAANPIGETSEPPITAEDTPLFVQIAPALEPPPGKSFTFTCPDCGYTNNYPSETSRAQGKRAHDRHCAEKVKVQR